MAGPDKEFLMEELQKLQGPVGSKPPAMELVENWLREHFHTWFLAATILDLLMLGWIAWKMRG